MRTPVISVVIPTCSDPLNDRSKSLREAVESVLKQTDADFEVIVIDDCSPFKPAAETLADITDPRLRVIRHEVNAGQATARNTGAEYARGKFLAFLDDDDFFHEGKLAQQLAYMKGSNKQRRHYKVSVTDFTLPGDQHLYNTRNSEVDPSWLILMERFIALPSTMMIEKKLFNHIGGFDPSPKLRRTEDMDFALKLLFDGQVVGIMPEYLSHYASFHPAKPEVELKALKGIEEKYRNVAFPDRAAAEKFRFGLDWKIANIESTGKPLMSRLARLAGLARRHPIHFSRIGFFHIGNPFHRIAPPSDRPKIGLPLGSNLAFPYVPL